MTSVASKRTSEPAISVQHERAFIRAFVVVEKQERWASLLLDPKRRRAFTHVLAHTTDFDERWTIPIPSAEQTVEGIYHLLRNKGAPEVCHVVSENMQWDNQEMCLREAVELVLGAGLGTVIACLPDRLAFYESEYRTRRLLLRR